MAQVRELIRSHIHGDRNRFRSIALQIVAKEKDQGHHSAASELQKLIDKMGVGGLFELKGDLAKVLTARQPSETFDDITLPADLLQNLQRILAEQRRKEELAAFNLSPSRKIMLVGPPGCGKTLTARILAHELGLPLFSVDYSGLIDSYLGVTAGRVKSIFEMMKTVAGVYFFDEFDAIATQRSGSRDVAEMNRVLNSFLQYLEDDDSEGLIVTASNHPEIVDKALFRRFDAVIRYRKPARDEILLILRDRLSAMSCPGLDKPTAILDAAIGLSQAEIVAVANEALKSAILDGAKEISDTLLTELLQIRQAWNQEGLG